MANRRQTLLLFPIWVVMMLGCSWAAPNYDDDVYPIFEESCLNCHNPDKKKGDLDLSTYSGAMAGSSGGTIAEAGEGKAALLYVLCAQTEEPIMPPKGSPLSAAHLKVLLDWIEGGMLENKTGQPKKKKAPTVALSMPATDGEKPKGPPPMPKDLNQEPSRILSRAGVVADMAASPWAPLLAVTGQEQVLLYNTNSLRLLGILPFPDGQPLSLSFHPSGKYLLASGGIGGKSGHSLCWEIESGKEVFRAGKDFDAILSASLRADMKAVAYGGPAKRVKIWNLEAGAEEYSIKKHTDWVTQARFSPDGVLLATGSRGAGIYVWEGHSGNEYLSLRGHKAAITDLAWRSDSNLLATSSEDGHVILWDMNSGKEVKKQKLHNEGILAMDWHRGGNFVTAGRDQMVKLSKPDLKGLRHLPKFSSLVTEVAFSQDGKRLFTADWQGVIDVWEVSTGQKIGFLEANPPAIASRIGLVHELVLGEEAKLQELDRKVKALEAALKKNKDEIAYNHNKIGEQRSQRDKTNREKNHQNNEVKRFGQQIAKLRDQINKAEEEKKIVFTKELDALNVKKKEAAHKIAELNKKLPDFKKNEQNARNLIKKLEKWVRDSQKPIAEAKKTFTEQEKKVALAKGELVYWQLAKVKSVHLNLKQSLEQINKQRLEYTEVEKRLSEQLKRATSSKDKKQLSHELAQCRERLNVLRKEEGVKAAHYELSLKKYRALEERGHEGANVPKAKADS